MEFVKNWLSWIILGIIVLVCLGVRLTVISSYLDTEEKSRVELIAKKKKLEKAKKDIGLGKIPTKGDIKQAEGKLNSIKKEWERTAKAWKNASNYLNKKHGKDPATEYSVFLLRKCEELCSKLAEARLKTIDPKAVVSKVKAPFICNTKNHQIADVNIDYHTVAETESTWKKYLISSKIHEVCAKSSVKVDDSYSLEPQNDATGKVSYIKKSSIRTIENLGDIDFGEVVTAKEANSKKSAKSGRGRRSRKKNEDTTLKKNKVYHTTYPASFEVTAHIKVVQQIMKNILRADKLHMVFVPVKVEINRFTDEETKAVAMNVDSQQSCMYVDKSLNYTREPPVRAVLSYDVYSFDDINGTEKNKTNKRKSRRGK